MGIECLMRKWIVLVSYLLFLSLIICVLVCISLIVFVNVLVGVLYVLNGRLVMMSVCGWVCVMYVVWYVMLLSDIGSVVVWFCSMLLSELLISSMLVLV